MINVSQLESKNLYSKGQLRIFYENKFSISSHRNQFYLFYNENIISQPNLRIKNILIK